MAPLNKRVLSAGVTVHHGLSESLVQPAMTSAALRRIARPRGKLIKSLPFDATKKPDQLLTRVNNGEVSAAPPKVTPPGIFTADQAADLVKPADAPSWVPDLVRKYPRIGLLILIIAILLALLLFFILPLAVAVGIAVVLLVIGVWAYQQL